MGLWKLFRLLVYLGLLAGGLFFVKTSFEDYAAGHTIYSVSNELITLADLPTMVICIDFHWRRLDVRRGWLNYGNDFTIYVQVSEENNKTIQLLDNSPVQTLYSLEFQMTELLPRYQKANGRDMRLKQCYKVMANWHGNEEIDFGRFRTETKVVFDDRILGVCIQI